MNPLPDDLQHHTSRHLDPGFRNGPFQQPQGFAGMLFTIGQRSQSVMCQPDAAVPAGPAKLAVMDGLAVFRFLQVGFPLQGLGIELDRLLVGVVCHGLITCLFQVFRCLADGHVIAY